MSFCIVCYEGSGDEYVSSYSGGSGDIYESREEAEEMLYCTRVEMAQYRPSDRYELFELVHRMVAPGEEKRAPEGKYE